MASTRGSGHSYTQPVKVDVLKLGKNKLATSIKADILDPAISLPGIYLKEKT